MLKNPQKTEKTIRTVLIIALIAYVIFVLWYTVFGREPYDADSYYEGELFWSLRRAINDPQKFHITEVVYNCLMLTPVGFALAWVLSPAVFKDREDNSADKDSEDSAGDKNDAEQGQSSAAVYDKKIVGVKGDAPSEIKVFAITVASGFMLTCTIEILQLVLHRGLFEYDDIIYNTFGTILGYLGYRLTRYIIVKYLAT